MANSRKLEENLGALWTKSGELIQLGHTLAKQKGQPIGSWLQKIEWFQSEAMGMMREYEDIKGGRGHISQLELQRKVTQSLKTAQYLEQEGKASLEPKTFLQNLEKKLKRFTEGELRMFTSDFSRGIGSGGFGKVFKGKLSDGRKIAVKVLMDVGADLVEETFKAEVETMASTIHRNLITLHGYCFEVHLKALVYEFMEKGSLDMILSSSIEWGKLYNIATETAMGISYLHDGCKRQIIHYDIKPANVLIDQNYSPKITDFGLAKLTNRDASIINSGRRGTPGYIAPELIAQHAKVSEKCDVYSYGMMLFDILWRNNIAYRGKPNHLRLVKEMFENGQLDQLLQHLGLDVNDWSKAKTLCMVALRCVQYAPESRPDMTEVVNMLKNAKLDTTKSKPTSSEFQHHFRTTKSEPTSSEFQHHFRTTNSDPNSSEFQHHFRTTEYEPTSSEFQHHFRTTKMNQPYEELYPTPTHHFQRTRGKEAAPNTRLIYELIQDGEAGCRVQ